MACAFCELVRTGEARWVTREPDAVAFAPLPADEFAPGHTLVVPRRHSVGLHDADERDVVAVAALVRRVSRAMLSALGATGVVVLNASGPNSGQTVAHLHVHVVPRAGTTTRRRCHGCGSGPPGAFPNRHSTYWPPSCGRRRAATQGETARRGTA